eukprot:437981-Pelagomonas_calceolata.AAC.1
MALAGSLQNLVCECFDWHLLLDSGCHSLTNVLDYNAVQGPTPPSPWKLQQLSMLTYNQT